jgi:hypothetical protein
MKYLSGFKWEMLGEQVGMSPSPHVTFTSNGTVTKLTMKHTSARLIKLDSETKSPNPEPSRANTSGMSNSPESSIRERQERKLPTVLVVKVLGQAHFPVNPRSRRRGVGRRKRRWRRGIGSGRWRTGDRGWRRKGWIVCWGVSLGEQGHNKEGERRVLCSILMYVYSYATKPDKGLPSSEAVSVSLLDFTLVETPRTSALGVISAADE